MSAAHLDPNISLGLNILEGCRLANFEDGVSVKPFGVDSNQENTDQMLSCVFRLADALRNRGITGVYFHLALIYKASLPESEKAFKGESHWDSVRMLHLLPKFARKHSRAGEWPIPALFTNDEIRNKAMRDIYPSIRLTYGEPLSFVPDIDKHWLGNDAVDVFGVLEEPLKELLDEVQNGEAYAFPEKSTYFDRWLRHKFETGVEDYRPAALLYLCTFFPYRITSLALGHGTLSADWLIRDMGDTELMAHDNTLAILKYGPAAIRLWMEQVRHRK